MKSRVLNNTLNIVMVIAMAMFFSCNSNLKEVREAILSENEPAGIAENINLKYTESGRVTANLISTKMLDFTNRNFPYNEFPEGITLYLYDENNNKSTVVSDYAIVYNQTNLIDLQGNVVITTKDSSILKTNQLYYEQKKGWAFTNKPVYFTTTDYVINGNGFDSNSEFTNAEVIEINDGTITVED